MVGGAGPERERARHPVTLLGDPNRTRTSISFEKTCSTHWAESTTTPSAGLATRNLVWMARVVGAIAYAIHPDGDGEVTVEDLARRSADPPALVDSLFTMLGVGTEGMEPPGAPTLFSINRNRQALTSIFRSVPTVKGDAAQHLFSVRGKGITWAVLDSGIDATHLAFRTRRQDGSLVYRTREGGSVFAPGPGVNNRSRVRKTYDFTRSGTCWTQTGAVSTSSSCPPRSAPS